MGYGVTQPTGGHSAPHVNILQISYYTMAKKDTKQEEVVEEVEQVVEEVQETKASGFSVQDPEVLRPKELPLVITPDKGSWANEAQAEYAQVLNGYAYKNPTKWAKKKDVLLVNLEKLETDPAYISFLRGNIEEDRKTEYGNKLAA